MREFTRVDLDFEELEGHSQVFVPQETGFSACDLGKTSKAIGSERQEHFYRQLERLSLELGSDVLPVFVRWKGYKTRMDKGCVGHALASGRIDEPTNGRGGIVTHIRYRSRPDANV